MNLPTTAGGEEVAASVAFATEERIKETVRHMRTAWLVLAEGFYKMREHELYKDLGHETFEGWIAQAELDVDVRWVYQLIANWREVVVNLQADPKQLAGIEPTKLRAVLPAVRRGQVDLEQALADCKVLSRRDLDERYSTDSARALGPDTSTTYDAEAEPEFSLCEHCGSYYRTRAA